MKVGGRGKAGGVQLARDAEEVQRHASNILGMDIKGHVVSRLWIQKDSDIAREYYASFTLDRAKRLHLCMVSSREAWRSSRSPRRILMRSPGCTSTRSRSCLGRRPEGSWPTRASMRMLVPRRPTCSSSSTTVTRKVTVIWRRSTRWSSRTMDASWRWTPRSPSTTTPRSGTRSGRNSRTPRNSIQREKLAKEKGLTYIGLSGSVGIIANGAGLAMSTLDVVNQVGGTAANFLDIGGGASAEVMASALEVINSDDAVRSILVNVFGGITRVDEVANGVVEAMRRVELRSPIVLRLDGTNAEKGLEILADHLSERVVVEETMVGRGSSGRRPRRRCVVSIFVDENTKVVVQGLTGSQGRFHGLRNRDYGTKVVAGVTPGKGGSDVDGVPVYDTVEEAVAATGADASFVVVPPKFAPDAIVESASAGVRFIVCITEGIPAQDEALFFNRLRRDHPGTRLLGPNCPGVISPGKCNIGITPGAIALPGGPVGMVSRSGTLTYQALHDLSQQDVGQTTCVGIGGDPVPGTGFIDCLAAFEKDPDTRAVMMIGEIGGSEEEQAAQFIADHMTKPVVCYIAGVTAPPGRKMGHAGAIISGSHGTAQAKMEALAAAGATCRAEPDGSGRAHGEGGEEPRLKGPCAVKVPQSSGRSGLVAWPACAWQCSSQAPGASSRRSWRQTCL